MSSRIFIANQSTGISRAHQPNGQWRVDTLLPQHTIHCLATGPTRGGAVFAGTRGEGVLRSNDQGATWKPAGLAGQIVKSLAVSPARPGLVFAGAKPPALFVSHNNGDTWEEVVSFRKVRAWWWRSPAEPDLGAYIQSIALSPTDPNVIIVGIEFGAVLRSLDGGQTWEGHRPGALRDCHNLAFHASDANWVYEAGGSGKGAAFSRDAGHSWRQPGEGLDRHYGWAVAADPSRPEIWYVSISPLGSKSKPFIPAAHVDGEANAHIFRSVGGAAWQKLGGGLPQPLNHMAYGLLTDVEAPGHVYAGLSNGEVWHSADHGDSWTQLPFNMQAIRPALIMLKG